MLVLIIYIFIQLRDACDALVSQKCVTYMSSLRHVKLNLGTPAILISALFYGPCLQSVGMFGMLCYMFNLGRSFPAYFAKMCSKYYII